MKDVYLIRGKAIFIRCSAAKVNVIFAKAIVPNTVYLFRRTQKEYVSSASFKCEQMLATMAGRRRKFFILDVLKQS